jgi:hypothetical protein
MSKQTHSHAYHRYFENYAEREILLPDGGRKIQRIYVGKYYRVDLPDDQLRQQKITLGLLFGITLFGYFTGALTAGVSAFAPTALLTMPPLIALLFLGIAVFYRLTVPREMEIRAFRDSSDNLKRSSMAFLICSIICFAASLSACLLIPLFPLKDDLFSLLCYLISSIAALMIYLAEKKTPYRTLLPKQERPDKSSPIRYEIPD